MSTLAMHSGVTAIDGTVGREGAANDSWATLISSGGNTTDTDSYLIMALASDPDPDEWQSLRRGVFLFDSTPLPPGSILQSANVSFHCNSIVDRNFSSSFVLGNAPVDSYTGLTAADYNRLHLAKVEHSDDRVTLASLTAGVRFDFDLNATAITTLQSTFVSGNAFELGLYFDWDFDEVAPTWQAGTLSDQIGIRGYQAGAPDWPILTVTYRIGRGYATVQLTGTLANGGDTVTADMFAVEVFT